MPLPQRFLQSLAYLLLAFSPCLFLGSPADLCRVERLFKDLEIVRQVNAKIHDSPPLLLNYQGMGGYFAMPSARMPEVGMAGFSYSYVPPYRLWNLTYQMFGRVETGGTYWVYHGQLDPGFGHLGFGDEADRTVFIKFRALSQEDGFPYFPDLSGGWIDFLGSRHFYSAYVVATEMIPFLNLEATLGMGWGRIKGLFGGLAWTPWLRSPSLIWRGITFAAEYDATDYEHHVYEHTSGRTVDSRVNAGFFYRIGPNIQAAVSSIRGKEVAASINLHYNLGQSEGFLPKIQNPPPFKTPTDIEAIGRLRSSKSVAIDLAHAFQDQGVTLRRASIYPTDQGGDALSLQLANFTYRDEKVLHERITRVLSRLTPTNLSSVTTIIEEEGLASHQYTFRRADLEKYKEACTSTQEMYAIAPMHDVSGIPSCASSLYKGYKSLWTFTATPRFATYFGSSKGKFKGQLGYQAELDGYLWDQIYYTISGSYTLWSMLQDITSKDVLNPSRMINVRTDAILYHHASSWHVDMAYLQRSWNLSPGLFGRLAVGYFETAYGGVAAEVLYYPVQANWALGGEASLLWKRNYYGLWFTRKIRKLEPHGLKHERFLGVQYFLDWYYNYVPYALDLRVRVGQFLARDKGVRLEAGRTFPSGVRMGLWYTFTNAEDTVNGERYFDKGVSFTLPLDLFLPKSSRQKLTYSASAWLRDCGAQGYTGKPLYPTIYDSRYNAKALID